MPRLSRRRLIGSLLFGVLFNAMGLVVMVEVNKHFVPPKKTTQGQVDVVHFREQQEKKKRPRPKQHQIRVKHRRAALPLPNLPSAVSAAGLGLALGNQTNLFGDLIGKGARFDGKLILKEDAVDVPPRVVARVPAEYPRRAEEREIEGYVVFKLQISEVGYVERVWTLESEPPGVFDAAAGKAVRQYRFSPAQYRGRAVQVLAKQKLIFKLGG